MSDSLSACISVATIGQVFVIFVSGALQKSIDQLHMWLKSCTTVGHFAWRHECVLYRLQRHVFCNSTENALLFFHSNASNFITLLTATCVRQPCEGSTLLRLHDNSGCATARRCNVVRSLPALFRWIEWSPPAVTALSIEPHRRVLIRRLRKIAKSDY